MVLDVFCNTSPLQYLHQVGELELLPALFEHVQVAEAVAAELAEGIKRQIALPNVEQLPWATTRTVSDTGLLLSGLGIGWAILLIWDSGSANGCGGRR